MAVLKFYSYTILHTNNSSQYYTHLSQDLSSRADQTHNFKEMFLHKSKRHVRIQRTGEDLLVESVVKLVLSFIRHVNSDCDRCTVSTHTDFPASSSNMSSMDFYIRS